MQHPSFRRVLFSLCLSVPFAVAACGDSDGPADSGQMSQADSGVHPDAFVPPDAGPPRDSGPLPDTGPSDAGHYCVANSQISVDGTNVSVDPASATKNPATGLPSALGCIDHRSNQMIAAPLAFRGCLEVIGGRPTEAEIADLDIAVFRERDGEGNLTDPSFDPSTGAERTPASKIAVDVSVIPDERGVCRSGFQVLIGRSSIGTQGVTTDLPFEIRVRSSTQSATKPWATSYYFGIVVGTDELESGGVSPDLCTPQRCTGRVDLMAVKRTGLASLITASGANIPGAADLDDGVGAGHAVIETYDCTDVAMQGAGAGFAPAPLAKSYLSGRFEWQAGGTATSSSAAFLGLGFTGTSTAGGVSLHAAVAVDRDGTCSEAFAGSKVLVFPDAITFVRSVREHTLN